MQGVRTTRGCINCRRRKKGCDFQRPSCSRCKQLHITCAYEERKYTFVNRSESPPERAARGSSRSSSGSPASISSVSSTALARTDMELLTDAGFWSMYLTNEDATLDGSVGGVLSAPWIPTVRVLAAGDSHVRTALYACAFAGLGWLRDDGMSIRHGTHLYAKALKETNVALQDPMRVQSDSLLACCRLLSLFEMFRRTPGADEKDARPQSQDWQQHVDGTCHIIRIRGRDKHLSGPGRDLYDGVRMTAVILGLVKRRPNDFTNLPWTLPRQDNLRDELFDLICTVPELFQQSDQLIAEITVLGSIVDDDEVVRRAWNLLQWYGNTSDMLQLWESKAIETCQEIGPTEYDEPQQGGMVPLDHQLSLRDVCKSHGDGFFFICTQYWTMCLKVYTSARLFYNRVLPWLKAASLDNAMSPSSLWMSPEPHALNIAQVTEYFFRSGAGLWSAQSAVFPVGNALAYFSHTGRRNSAIFKMMTDSFIENKNGAVMRDFLHNIVDGG